MLGHEDEALAFAHVRNGYDGGKRIGPQLGGERFDGRKRDHFAADLGEPLGAALDRDEASLVNSDDIAGVVPAFRWRLQNPGIFRSEVSEHHVRPAHPKPSTLLNSFDRIEPCLHAREQAADAAELVEHRRVQRECRRRLGHSVTFENAQPELLHIHAPRRFLDRLRARQDVTQRAEVVGVRRARIPRKKRVRAEHDRGVYPVDELGDGPIVKRRGIQIDAHAGDERQDDSDREPE